MDEKEFMEVLDKAVSIVEKTGVDYALIGGTAAQVYTYPKFLEDIDVLVKEEDAEPLLTRLEEAGLGQIR